MKYRIDNQIIIEKPDYGALGDDFSFGNSESVGILIKDIEDVLSGTNVTKSLYGNMCYRIDVDRVKSRIFCYDEFLGEETTIEVYNMFKKYFDRLSRV